MSEDFFKRSEVGHDASDLHSHDDKKVKHRDESSEREDLENAIEELNDFEEVENLNEIEREMSGDAPVEEAPEEEKEPFKVDAEEWKEKPESKAYMTVDQVIEPKAKKNCGAGWKIATVFFFILAVAGCSALAFMFFNDGKIMLWGRTIESYKTGTKATVNVNDNDEDGPAGSDRPGGDVEDEDSYLVIKETGFGIKVDKAKYNITYTIEASQTSSSRKVARLWLSLASDSTVPDFANMAKNVGGMATITFSNEPMDDIETGSSFMYAPNKYALIEYSHASYSSAHDENNIKNEEECQMALYEILDERNISAE